MSRQAKVSRPGEGRPMHDETSVNPRQVAGNVAGVVHDVVELMELQAKLFVVDSKVVLRGTVAPLVLIVTSACVLLGAMPVAWLGVAELLVEQTELTHTASLLIAAAAGAGVALLLFVVAWWRLRRGLHRFDSSIDELERNVAWIKRTLKRSDLP